MKQKLIITICIAALFALLTACEPQTGVDYDTTNANLANDNAMNSNMMNSNALTESENPKVGGADMLKDKNIVENASAAGNLSTLVAAVKQADLVGTLEGAGPFTVFAPTNDAFDKVPKDALDTLMKPESKDKLANILKYHVVPGNMDATMITAAIEKGEGGKAVMKTVQGEDLTASLEDGKVVITDAKGGKAIVTTADVKQSNGVVHVIDSVLMPK